VPLSRILYYNRKRGNRVFITDMLNTKTRLKPILSFIATRIPAMLSGERAQTTAEYGLIVALVLIATLIAMVAMSGAAVQGLWNTFVTAWPS